MPTNTPLRHSDRFPAAPGGLNIRWPDDRYAQDERLQEYKAYAAIAFARANSSTADDGFAQARFGIISSGKSYEDMRQALRQLGINERVAAEIGLRLYKVRMPWPLEPEGVRHFSEGLEEIFIVEERREIIEHQVKQQLFNWRDDVRPRIVGKFDDQDKHFLFAAEVAWRSLALLADLAAARLNLDPEDRRDAARRPTGSTAGMRPRCTRRPVARTPHFCSGCPHNTSTKVPEGSRAMAGIGCHFMALWMDRNTETYTHMGGEGVPWWAPRPSRPRSTCSPISATAPTSTPVSRDPPVGGCRRQHHLQDPLQRCRRDDRRPACGRRTFAAADHLPASCRRHQRNLSGLRKPATLSGVRHCARREGAHRDELDDVQRPAHREGRSAIVFVQTCAAEKRRRRKRGLMEDPARRVLINPAVCEGCGDCSVQSNCISVEPLETELGRKRKINQSTCNKDYSCVKGFCPSFVTVEGGKPRSRAPASLDTTTRRSAGARLVAPLDGPTTSRSPALAARAC